MLAKGAVPRNSHPYECHPERRSPALAGDRSRRIRGCFCHHCAGMRSRPAPVPATTATAKSASPSSKTKNAPTRSSAASGKCSPKAWYTRSHKSSRWERKKIAQGASPGIQAVQIERQNTRRSRVQTRHYPYDVIPSKCRPPRRTAAVETCPEPVEGDPRSLLSPLRRNAISPGIGSGDYGDHHVRFALIENEERTRQPLRGVKQMFAKGLVPA